MRKSISILVALMMLAMVVLSGCGTSAPAASATPTPASSETNSATPAPSVQNVEIRVAWWGDTKRHELYGQILDAFEAANPGIKTVREPMGWADYWDKLTVQSASGGAPDFMGMHPQFANDYLRRGVIEPLDGYINDGTIDISKMSQGAVKSGTVDGKTYMIPMGLTGQSFFINKTFLTDLGLEMPSFNWTWDDLKALGLKGRAALDAKGQSNIWIIDDNSNNYQLFRYWVRQNGKELYTPDGNLGYTAEDVAAWWAYWKDLRDNKIAPDAATTVEYGTATLENSLFAQQKIAMRGVPANQFKLYVAALPNSELVLNRNPSKVNGQTGEYVEGAHFAVSSKTTPEKKLAAAKLINFWVNTEASYSFFGMDQGVPANSAMAEFIKPKLDAPQLTALEYVGKIAELAGQAPPTVYPPAGASEIDSAFKSTAEQVMYDAMSPADAAKEFMNLAQAVIDKNKK